MIRNRACTCSSHSGSTPQTWSRSSTSCLEKGTSEIQLLAACFPPCKLVKNPLFSIPTNRLINPLPNLTVSSVVSAVDMSLLALAVVTGAVRSLDDAGCPVGLVSVSMSVSVAPVTVSVPSLGPRRLVQDEQCDHQRHQQGAAGGGQEGRGRCGARHGFGRGLKKKSIELKEGKGIAIGSIGRLSMYIKIVSIS